MPKGSELNKGKLPFGLTAIVPIIFILVFNSFTLLAQETAPTDSTISPLSDTLITPQDSLSSDSLVTDSVPEKKSFLDSKVTYDSDISQTLKLSKGLMVLKGNAKVRYEKIKLDAEVIEYNFNEKTVYAYGAQDTAGEWYGLPVFEENGQKYEAFEIRYNFESKKGFIKEVKTSLDNSGHLRGKTVKKDTNDVMFVKNGEFCPCEDPDALTTIKVNKIKVIPNSKIITGPGYLRIGKIPTPLAFPFGFFPNKNKQSAGVLIPSYGEDATRGFFLINGGFYTPLSEYADLQITGDIYTRGSYAYNLSSNYRKRYGFNGKVSYRRNVFINGDELLGTRTEEKTNNFVWVHNQDPKARPNSRFSANVNMGSQNRNRNTVNVTSQNYLSSSFNSSLKYDKSWANNPFKLGIAARYNQNTATGKATLSLPEMAISGNRFYLPLSFLNPNGTGNKWYEKIGVTYNSNLKNTVTDSIQNFSLENFNSIQRQMSNGMRHQTALSTSLKKWHLTVNPSLNISETWYTKRLEKVYDVENQALVTDTVNKFKRFEDYSANVNVNTKVFGMFRYKKGPVQAFRHVITPSVGFQYRPKHYQLPTYIDTTGTVRDFNPYQGSIYGGPSTSESGTISLGLQNNFEAKLRNENETKIKILDNLNFNSGYDLFKDSLNWSNISANARTTLFKKINIVYNGNYAVYMQDSLGRSYNELRIANGKSIGRLEYGTFNIGASVDKKDIQSILFKKDGTEEEDKPKKEVKRPKELIFSMNANYTVNLRRDYYKPNLDSLAHTKGLSFGGNFGFTNLFKLGFSSGWDYENKKLSYTTLNIYVDLNCWELTARVIPIGNIKSYWLKLNMKSNLLKDAKLERNKSFITDEDNF
mgnify:CR=1 FL=1